MPIDQPISVTPVVVAASHLPPAAGDPAYSIIKLPPAVLKTSDRLDTALQTAPGFSLYRRISSLGANPTTQGMSLRGIAGSAASRALVTLDGVPQNDPFGGWVIWTSLPPEAVGAASIVRGAGAGPYGAGALTGVVALESPTDIPGSVAGEAEGGSLGYARGGAVAEISGDRWAAFLDASGERSAGWIPVREGRGAADRALSLSDWSAAERVVADFGDEVLTERISGFEEERGAGVLFAGSRAEGGQASLTLVRQPTASATGWRLQAWAEATNLVNSSASVSLNRNSATLADDEYATPATGFGANAALRRDGAGYSWEIGADARLFSGEARDRLYSKGVFTGLRIGGGAQWIAGAYAEGTRLFGRWLLTGGARLDGWETYGSKLIQTGAGGVDERPPNRSGLAPNGRLGLRRELGDGQFFRAAAYTSFRPPTLNELHRAFRVGNDVTLANAALAPERLYGFEAGFGGRGRLAWDADVFFNRLGDAVTNVTIGHGPGLFPVDGFVPAGGALFERRNAGVINAVGFEADVDYRLTEGVDLRAALDLTRARVDGGSQAPQLTGLRPAETPEAVATAGVEWRATSRLSLSGFLRYQSSEFDDDLNTRPIRGGTQVDVRLAWKLTHRLALFAAVDNVFDADLQTGRSAAGVVTYAAPRIVRGGITISR